MSTQRYQWAAPGDVNAFFGLMLDNVADLLLAVGLLAAVYDFPTTFALQRMVPGTAIGVVVGDLLFFWMALALAKRTGRNDVTAMPLGLDTPSTLGMVFFVLGPSFVHASTTLKLGPEAAAHYTWQIGICTILISGLFKMVCALGSNWIRRVVPRAGLLGSLTAVALVLISFMPFLEVLQHPVAGFAAMAIVLTSLVARVRVPLRIPGALAALLVGGLIYYLMQASGTLGAVHEPPFDPRQGLFPGGWLAVFQFEWFARLEDSLVYLPIVIPFALATVVGGIDCTESAAAAGDDYDTGRVILVEALATVIAALCGGVIQSTPYIGHPAYKAMGGRAAYTLATAVFIGAAGLLGFFGYLYLLIPKAVVFPVLIFIGLEITSQSFQATPRRHYAALALACVPALAALAWIFSDKLLGAMAAAGVSPDALGHDTQRELQSLRLLYNGFIVTSLIWASALASIIDRKLILGAFYFAVAAACTSIGVMHSPLPGGQLFLPWQLPSELLPATLRYLGAYVAVTLILLAWGLWLRTVASPEPTSELDPETGAAEEAVL